MKGTKFNATGPQDNNACIPNEPHPVLEYPPLYFVLKRLPPKIMGQIMNAITTFYKIDGSFGILCKKEFLLASIFRNLASL